MNFTQQVLDRVRQQDTTSIERLFGVTRERAVQINEWAFLIAWHGVWIGARTVLLIEAATAAAWALAHWVF